MSRREYTFNDMVVLHPEPEHEGPHPSDADPRPLRVAVVQHVIRHPGNPDWITHYDVTEFCGDHVEHLRVKPGAIAREATLAEYEETIA